MISERSTVRLTTPARACRRASLRSVWTSWVSRADPAARSADFRPVLDGTLRLEPDIGRARRIPASCHLERALPQLQLGHSGGNFTPPLPRGKGPFITKSAGSFSMLVRDSLPGLGPFHRALRPVPVNKFPADPVRLPALTRPRLAKETSDYGVGGRDRAASRDPHTAQR